MSESWDVVNWQEDNPTPAQLEAERAKLAARTTCSCGSDEDLRLVVPVRGPYASVPRLCCAGCRFHAEGFWRDA
jgi:hypothetical protein